MSSKAIIYLAYPYLHQIFITSQKLFFSHNLTAQWPYHHQGIHPLQSATGWP